MGNDGEVATLKTPLYPPGLVTITYGKMKNVQGKFERKRGTGVVLFWPTDNMKWLPVLCDPWSRIIVIVNETRESVGLDE